MGRLTTGEYPSKRFYDFNTLLLCAILFLEFVPIPKLPVIRLAPNNILYAVGITVIVFHLHTVLQNKSLLILVSILIFYALLKNALFYFRGQSIETFGALIRCVVLVELINIACNSDERIRFILKYFLLLCGFSVLFGLLVYFFGSPFADIRNALRATMGQAGKAISAGSQLTGLHEIPHIFGYYLASTPIMTLGLLLTSRKTIWTVLLAFLLVGLFLNAERSAILANVCVFAIWIWFDRRNRRMLIRYGALTMFFLVLFAAVHPYVAPKAPLTSGYTRGTLTERLQATSLDEALGRIMWQLHGIRTVLKHPLRGSTHEDYIRTVHDLPSTKTNLQRYQKTPAPHNHYINIGMHGGALGWLLLFFFAWVLVYSLSRRTKALSKEQAGLYIYQGVLFGFMAVLINALFHNDGIFFYNTMTWFCIALLFSYRNIMKTGLNT
ncbi:MAG: O-antigen ligase family protein [Thermodesulfobacteriota bacterium]|nr:O-antigen ligase family protein [Thermodesulfobacteriota bacterium]